MIINMAFKSILSLNPVNVKHCINSNRTFSVSSINGGKHNFTKFILYNRGTAVFRKQQEENPNPNIPHYQSGVREVGYKNGKKLVVIPEMIPDVIVPDLTDFKLKPYVSYKVATVEQSEFTAKDLFDAIYSTKIANDFKENKLAEDGNSLDPSEEELVTAEQAFNKAKSTGTDIFKQRTDWTKDPLVP